MCDFLAQICTTYLVALLRRCCNKVIYTFYSMLSTELTSSGNENHLCVAFHYSFSVIKYVNCSICISGLWDLLLISWQPQSQGGLIVMDLTTGVKIRREGGDKIVLFTSCCSQRGERVSAPGLERAWLWRYSSVNHNLCKVGVFIGQPRNSPLSSLIRLVFPFQTEVFRWVENPRI